MSPADKTAASQSVLSTVHLDQALLCEAQAAEEASISQLETGGCCQHPGEDFVL